MSTKPSRNKAEAPADADKSGDPVAAMRAEIAEMDDAAVNEHLAKGRIAVAALQDEARRRGIEGLAPGDRRSNPGAGNSDGSFVCLREMEGDRSYRKGDPRSGKVSELAHLVKSGALAPADADTAEAASAYLGTDVAAYSPPAEKGE